MERAVRDIVKRQVDLGIDIVSHGETSKISYATYVHDCLSGFSDEGANRGVTATRHLASFPDLRQKMAKLVGVRRFQACRRATRPESPFEP